MRSVDVLEQGFRAGIQRGQYEISFEKIFLDLYVKVNKNWRSSNRELRRFGYRE